MKNLYAFLLLFSSLFLLSEGVLAEEENISIILEQPIEINKSNAATGVIGSLSADAIQQGIDEARVKGDVQYESLKDGKTRVNINWSSVTKQNGSTQKNVVLENNLVSQFITSSENIDPNISVSAKGDLVLFSEAINELFIDDGSSFDSSNINLDEDEEGDTATYSANDENLAAAYGNDDYSNVSSSSDDPSAESGATQEDNVTLKSETWEACTDRVDGASGLIYPRAKKVVTDGNGAELERGSCQDYGEPREIGTTVEWETCISDYDNVNRLVYEKAKKIITNEFGTEISRGECEVHGAILEMEVTENWEDCPYLIDEEDGYVYEQGIQILTNDKAEEIYRGECITHGEVAEIQKVYGEECVNLNDYINLLTYPSFRKYAIVGGKELNVSTCTSDASKAIELVTDSENCLLRHDFLKGYAIQQWKYFYEENGEIIDATECLDSDITYTYYKTTVGCEAVVDSVNGVVFPQKRSAFKKLDGTIDYASECAPVGSESVALSSEYCSQKYEHDLGAGQSYRRIQKYYNDFTTGEKIYASGCVRDTSISFTHVKQTSGCGYVHNDSQRYSILNAKTQITTSEDGVITIAACQQYGGTIYYVLSGSGESKTHVGRSCWYYARNMKRDNTPGIGNCPTLDFNDWRGTGCVIDHIEDYDESGEGAYDDKYRLWVWAFYPVSYYRRGDGSTLTVNGSSKYKCGPNY